MQMWTVAACAAFSLTAGTVLGLSQTGSFTVSDSIQMTHFNDPTRNTANPPAWKISPDGANVLLVTTRGIVAEDEVESTLWILDLRAVSKFLEERDSRTPPSPKEIVRAKGQLRANQGDSNGALITDCQWSSDSTAIYMLMEKQGGRRELDRVNVFTGREERMSPEDSNVDNYEVDSRGVLYSAARFRPTSLDPEVIESVRDHSLDELLRPLPSLSKKTLFRADLSGVRSISPAPVFSSGNSFFLSPDGTRVVALVPVEKTPTLWKAYLPAFPEVPLYRPENSRFPVTEYEVVDLRTNSRRPLLGSPSGVQGGYPDQTQVVWSSHGDHILVTNTFLPFEHLAPEEQEARRRPCAVAHISMDDGSASCIVFERSTKAHESDDSWAVSNVKFGGTDHDVVIGLSWRGRHKTECYSVTDDVWAQDASPSCGSPSPMTSQHTVPTRVRLELRQSLDEPPRLWAEDLANSRRLQIWDPNPQIAGKSSGTTSIYRWVDKDGREWTGGLVLPSNYVKGTRYPLVVQTHGFRASEFLVDGPWSTAMAARPLAAAGFVVLQIPDNREQTETLEEAKIHVDGYGAAIDQLASSGIVDPKRVGIIGFSRTCWYVEESLLESPRRFAAAVLADGYDASYLQYVFQRPDVSTFEPERYYGGKPVGRALETWIKEAPDFRLSAIETPLRIQAIGSFSLLTEWEIYASLRIQDKPVDFLYLPLGQHVLQNPMELMASEQGDVDWFRFWLKDEEDPASTKRPQYDRWEGLRKETAKTKEVRSH